MSDDLQRLANVLDDTPTGAVTRRRLLATAAAATAGAAGAVGVAGAAGGRSAARASRRSASCRRSRPRRASA